MEEKRGKEKEMTMSSTMERLFSYQVIIVVANKTTSNLSAISTRTLMYSYCVLRASLSRLTSIFSVYDEWAA